MSEKTIKRAFIQALPADNPYLSDEYVEVLKESFAHRPELLEAYLYGSWDALEGADQIIKAEWVRMAKSNKLIGFAHRPRLVVDTARFGDDETVIYYLETTEIEAEWIMAYTRTVDISHKLEVLSKQHGNCPIVVEATGGDLGAGVVDELVEVGRIVIVFNPQGKAVNFDRYYNLRSEAWSEAAKRFATNQIQLANQDLTLTAQLCAPRYKFKAGKTLVEKKEEIKKRLARSPDRGDAYIIGLWSYEKVPLVTKSERFRQEKTNLAESYTVETVL